MSLLLGFEVVIWANERSMNRSRKLGWHGYVDTVEAIWEVIGEMAGLGMVPPLE